jgi:hypothetical protein
VAVLVLEEAPALVAVPVRAVAQVPAARAAVQALVVQEAALVLAAAVVPVAARALEVRAEAAEAKLPSKRLKNQYLLKASLFGIGF